MNDLLPTIMKPMNSVFHIKEINYDLKKGTIF